MLINQKFIERYAQRTYPRGLGFTWVNVTYIFLDLEELLQKDAVKCQCYEQDLAEQ